MRVSFKHNSPGSLVIIGKSVRVRSVQMSADAVCAMWERQDHQYETILSISSSLTHREAPVVIISSESGQIQVLSFPSDRQSSSIIFHDGPMEVGFKVSKLE